MNSSQHETSGSGLSLPAPLSAEQLSSGETGQAAVEQAPAAPETAPQPGVGMPALPVAGAQAQVAAIAQDDSNPSNVQATTVSAKNSALPEDKDLIDRSVVEKAKAIVSRTQEDPYRQTQELSHLKAEFLQENYNKALKLNP